MDKNNLEYPRQRNLVLRCWSGLPVRNGRLALFCLLGAVLLAGFESALVQSITTGQELSLALFRKLSFFLLLILDLLLPLTIAMLSRRVLFVYLFGQSLLSCVLLHYDIFFYNPLTLSTIYHSLQGAAALGPDILGFARWNIITGSAVFGAVKILLVQLSRVDDSKMPRIWSLRGVVAVSCMAVICGISYAIYGKTGLSLNWIDSRGHRTATERRLEEGTRESVLNIGYLATWIGEWMSGTYKDTELIYAEMRCNDPDDSSPEPVKGRWDGLPLPPPGVPVVLLQVESLDFATVGMRVNGHPVLPFMEQLVEDSLFLKVFAPHKVGSCNSDYELLNGRIADQNVIYYSYIKEYPDSIIHRLEERGCHPKIFHGLEGNLFSLREAYMAQGFEQLYFKEELLKAGYTPTRYIMNHISDIDLFDYAAEKLVDDPEAAQFIITMTSHVPFIEPLSIFRGSNGRFARYVSSLHYFDQAFAAYYARLPQGTLLLIWGDHGSDVRYPDEYPDNARHVPFIVHVKGNTDWFEKIAAQPRAVEQAGALPVEFSTAKRFENTPEEQPATLQVYTSRIYTLCELAHYLRRIFQ